mgnify:FL=1
MTNKDKTMNTVKIFNHPVFGQVRIIEDDASSELLFCANDVTLALGYSNGRDAVAKHVDEGDVAKRDTPIPNQYGTLVNQSVTYITESGVYALIFGSKQERAKEFKHWVTHEVLPSIRKTGQYSVKQPSINDKLQVSLTFADWTIKTLNLNEASKICWAKKIAEKFDIPTDALPIGVNAGTEAPTLHAAKDLLKENNIPLSATAFNRMLVSYGIIHEATRPSRVRNKLWKWKVLNEGYEYYGQNVQDPNYQSQTQIKWYDNRFCELLKLVGYKIPQRLI